MAFDFPNSPSVGQKYEPAGGPAFAWDGIAWKANVQGVPVTVYVSDTPPTSPALGQLWWDSDSGNLFIWYADGDSTQWVQVSGMPATAKPTAQTRNRLVNGAMQINQENPAVEVTGSGAFPVDQWQVGGISSSTFYSAWSGAAPFNYIYVRTTPADTSAAAGEVLRLQQIIEGNRVKDFGFGTAGSKQAVIAFDVMLPVAGTYWVALTNVASTHSWLGSYTISAAEAGTWVRRTLVVPAGAINAGAWPINNTGSCVLNFTFHCGATYTGVAGFQSGLFFAGPGQALGMSTTTTCYLTNVGLYLDPNNTGLAPPWQMPNEAEELQSCMRYYQPIAVTGGGYIGGVQSILHPFVIPPMRATPAFSGAGNNTNTTGATLVLGNPATYSGSGNYLQAAGIGASGYICGYVGKLSARM